MVGHSVAEEVDSSNFPRLDFSKDQDESCRTITETKKRFEEIVRFEQARADQGKCAVTDSWTRMVLS